MKVNKKKFKELIQSVTSGEVGNFPKWVIEDLSFQYVNTKKNRGEDTYDIIVSVDSIDNRLICIRDVVEFVCGELDIDFRKIMVEI